MVLRFAFGGFMGSPKLDGIISLLHYNLSYSSREIKIVVFGSVKCFMSVATSQNYLNGDSGQDFCQSLRVGVTVLTF